MTLWRRIKRFSRSLVILALSCLVLEQVWYSVIVPGYFLGVLVSPVFWGLFSATCFYLLWRFDPDFFEGEEAEETEEVSRYNLPYDTNFMSPNYSHHLREIVMEKLA